MIVSAGGGVGPPPVPAGACAGEGAAAGPARALRNGASWFDNGDGPRSWRHIDAGFATVQLVATARRVNCPGCGAGVAAVPWARHASAFTRAFKDVVVHDAVVASKQAAADRYSQAT
jgi:transposase